MYLYIYIYVYIYIYIYIYIEYNGSIYITKKQKLITDTEKTRDKYLSICIQIFL